MWVEYCFVKYVFVFDVSREICPTTQVALQNTHYLAKVRKRWNKDNMQSRLTHDNE